jgi:hypothetical protein
VPAFIEPLVLEGDRLPQVLGHPPACEGIVRTPRRFFQGAANQRDKRALEMEHVLTAFCDALSQVLQGWCDEGYRDD